MLQIRKAKSFKTVWQVTRKDRTGQETDRQTDTPFVDYCDKSLSQYNFEHIS